MNPILNPDDEIKNISMYSWMYVLMKWRRRAEREGKKITNKQP